MNALMFSHIGKNIKVRGGQGLAASKLLREGFSYRIAKDQWKLEAKQLFKTSLARMHIDVRDIALGTGAKYGGQKKRRSKRRNL